MANVQMIGPYIWNTLDMPPGGLVGLWIGPVPSGAVILTAHGLSGLVTGPQSLTVVKLTARTVSNPNECIIDFTVRNDGPNRCRFVRVLGCTITP
jgi:hypothetical protein